MKNTLQTGLWGIASLLVAGAMAASFVFFVLVPDLPAIETIRQMELTIPLRVYTIDGRLMAEYGDHKRSPVPIEEAPEVLVNAILSAEDDRFFQHHGVDFSGVIRALIANLRSRNIVQGFSTITMQVAGNYFLDRRERTYTRKIQEILLAFNLEAELTKWEILELYLNKIFLGQRAYGFGAAAVAYYDKTLDELSLAQIATLAGIPKAPSTGNPVVNPEGAKVRRNYVLRRMRDLDYISEENYLTALKEPVIAHRHAVPIEVDAPYVSEIVRSYMLDTYGQSAYEKGYSVYTTINSDYQIAASQALRRGLIAYDQRHGYRGPSGFADLDLHRELKEPSEALHQYTSIGGLKPAVVSAVTSDSVDAILSNGEIVQIGPAEWKWTKRNVPSLLRTGDVIYVGIDGNNYYLSQVPEIQGALVSLDPTDGALLALTGGFDFYTGKFNRATQARRQPGSNIKPFIYSAALDNGFTAATLVSGAPIVVKDALGDTWRPQNYSKKVFGPTRLRKALTLSLNLVSVRLVRALGTELIIDHLEQFGFNSEHLPRGLSLALGSASLTPMEMARAYSIFANGGYLIEPYFIARVEDQNGEIKEYANRTMLCPECNPPADKFSDLDLGILHDARYSKRVLSEENAFLMNVLMREVIQTGTGRRALSLGRNDLAGKTGTTNNFRDAWFSGFNRDIVSTVWVGFDSPRDLGASESGARAALPIWIDYMEVALQGKPEKPLPIPENIITAWVHKDTGEAVSVNDSEGFEEFFVMGTEPHALVRGGAPAIGPETDQSIKTIKDLF